MKKVLSHSDFISKTSKSHKSYLLLFNPSGEQSNCAYKNIEEGFKGKSETDIYSADVSTVRDIHTNYGITTVPSLLIFIDNKFKGVIKGCHESSYYSSLTENAVLRNQANNDVKPVKRVTVYSTPTCSWCNTLKSWLKQNNITYTDIDVSRDQRAAEDLVRRSGQQGVPQTDINGQIIVGFNQPILKELLGI